ncbi:hypothetical protein LPU83_pLPU83d_1366 (plasmid) [Rhizobium favelukesii]|uniref:Uncharacterized protein n=1 Tax=Rhizobium favelukesii TaxID=348824 RepID=W6S9D2_9HYPH|nr:hypothetical protein LPU83_pLPU83d_1366 [Rhizobium favelukesii]
MRLRSQEGIESLKDITFAILEMSCNISIIKKISALICFIPSRSREPDEFKTTHGRIRP